MRFRYSLGSHAIGTALAVQAASVLHLDLSSGGGEVDAVTGLQSSLGNTHFER